MPEVVGEAFVAIRPKVDGFAGEAQQKITAPLNAAFAGIATGIAARKVTDFFKGAFAEATDAAKVSAQTAAVLKSTGEAAGVSAKHIEDYAGKLSDLAAIDDEVIQQGENVLLTFTSIRNEAGKGNNVFDRATQAALDMSAALGTDLQGSIIQVGKALQDPIAGLTALRRVGVNFTDSQKELIASLVQSGDLLGAQKVILDELAKEFGGAAASQATASARLAVAFGNVKESIGTALLPAVSALAKALQPLADFFAENEVAAAALAVVLSGALLAGLLAWTINAAKSTLTTLGFAKAQEASAVAAETNAGALRGVAVAAAPWVAVAALATGAVVGLHQAFTNANGTLTVYTQNLLKLNDAQLKRAAALILAEGGEGDFRNAIKATAAESEVTARKLVNGANLPKKAKEDLMRVIDREIRQQERAAAAAGVATDAYDDQAGEVKSLNDQYADLVDAMDGFVNRSLDSEGAAIAMDRALEGFRTTMGETTIDTLEGREAFNQTKESIVRFGQSIFEERAALGDATQATRDQIGALAGVRDSLAPDSPLRQFLDSYINDLTNRIPRNIQTQIDALFTSNLAGSPAGTFNVVGATGGIVTRPTMALIGEAGPEAVIPLDSTPGSSPLPGGGDVIFQFLGGAPVDPIAAGHLAARTYRVHMALVGR